MISTYYYIYIYNIFTQIFIGVIHMYIYNCAYASELENVYVYIYIIYIYTLKHLNHEQIQKTCVYCLYGSSQWGGRYASESARETARPEVAILQLLFGPLVVLVRQGKNGMGTKKKTRVNTSQTRVSWCLMVLFGSHFLWMYSKGI